MIKKQKYFFRSEENAGLSTWVLNTPHYPVWLCSFPFCSLRFLLSETKAAWEQTVEGFLKLRRGEKQQCREGIVLLFWILLLHTSQSPENLLIIPRHLDKRTRKLSLYFGTSAELWVLESGVRVKLLCGHLTQDSNRVTKSGDNANSNSAALAIIAQCKIWGSLGDNCPRS